MRYDPTKSCVFYFDPGSGVHFSELGFTCASILRGF
jgi:hypothetical protein